VGLSARSNQPILERRRIFGCAKTVSELHPFELLGLLFERKQIPQIVVNVRISRKTMEPLEATRLPWAHLRARMKSSLDITKPLSLRHPQSH
jgi:hypothetical protein